MVTPGAQPRQSPRSIAKAAADFAANRTAKLDFANVTTVISKGGDLAFSQGIYTSRHTNSATGAAETSKGYYILIYKKQPDGSWKIVQDVSSPLPDDFEPTSML
jgi:ketosteroid isomerase-like protein